MRHDDDEKTRWGSRHVVAADILRGLGKGFLIACAGIIVGLLIGTSPLAVERVFTILAAGTVGAACMGAAGALRQCEANSRTALRDTRSSSADELDIAPRRPDPSDLEHAMSEAPERRFVEIVGREREPSVDRTEEDRAVTRFVEVSEADHSAGIRTERSL